MTVVLVRVRHLSKLLRRAAGKGGSGLVIAVPLNDLYNISPYLMSGVEYLHKPSSLKGERESNECDPQRVKLWIASLAKIYCAYPNPNERLYAELQHGHAFAKESRGTITFKLVDLNGTRVSSGSTSYTRTSTTFKTGRTSTSFRRHEASTHGSHAPKLAACDRNA